MRTSDRIIITTLGHADAVAIGDLGDGDAVLDRRLQVDVIRADAGGDRQLSFFALAIRSAVRYAGQKGCEMTTSASVSARSKAEFGPSLSEVTMKVAQTFQELAQTKPTDTEPRSSPGLKSICFGVGVVWPPG